ncbi:MAG: hypothetical protein ABIF77_09425, partial [bacterium]
RSLKENVIMGHLISAGTGLSQFKSLAVEDPEEEEMTLSEARDSLELEAQQSAAKAEADGTHGEAEMTAR